jgi:hypothetical protein
MTKKTKKTTRRRKTTTPATSIEPFVNYDADYWDVQPPPRKTSHHKPSKSWYDNDYDSGAYKPKKQKKCKTACQTCPFAAHPLENVKYNVEVGTNDKRKLVIKPSVTIFGSPESNSQNYYEESNDVLANQYRDYMLQFKVPKKSKKQGKKSKKQRKSKKVKPHYSSEEQFFPDDYAKRRHRSLQPSSSGEAEVAAAAKSGEGSAGDSVASSVWKDERVLASLLKAAKDLNIGVKLAAE